jgi:hypothetical protein
LCIISNTSSPFDFPIAIQIVPNYKPVWDTNLILFFNFHVILILDINLCIAPFCNFAITR